MGKEIREYRGFVLDRFQREAINALSEGHHVFVSAPTGAGKTLIADYLIEEKFSQGKKIVYTSPIKALTNQKFREFASLFGDKVGILTGDVSLNRDAMVMVMTTEVFRNILFDDPEYTQDIGGVIFDEVHYLGDIERGTVWEEAIIFTPPHIQMLALSATISNVDQLAQWIYNIKNKKVVVVKETERPVPLFHYFAVANRGYLTLEELLQLNKRERRQLPPVHYVQVLADLKEMELTPVIFFIFSRLKTLLYAQEFLKFMQKNKKSLISPEQKEEIKNFFEQKVKDYKIEGLEIVKDVGELLVEGIGVHNAGLPYQLKIIVEELFSRSLLPYVFTTETFALGINMPARSVLFDSLSKYDGISFRELYRREYYQMAGRAGRRGIDEQGYAFNIVDFRFDSPQKIKNIVAPGEVEPVESQFNLSYNSVLNIFVKYSPQMIQQIMKSSFAQNQLDEKYKKYSKLAQNAKKIYCKKLKRKISYLKSLGEIERVEEETDHLIAQVKSQKKVYSKKERTSLIRSILRKKKRKIRKMLCFGCKHWSKCYGLYGKKQAFQNEIAKFLETYSPNYYFERYHKKLELLQRRGFCDEKGLLYKGEIARTIHGKEVIIAEAIFEEIISVNLSIPQLVSLLGVLVYEKRKNDAVYYKGKLDKTVIKRVEIINKIVKRWNLLEKEVGLEGDMEALSAFIYPIFYFWATGEKTLDEILSLCNLQEGDIIRLFRKVVDLIYMILKSPLPLPLKEKLKEAKATINRDIVDLEDFFISFVSEDLQLDEEKGDDDN